jgi:replication factor A1
MKISELKAGTGKADIEAKVIEKREPREVNTKFGRKLVCEAVLEDDSGKVILVLWGDEIEKVSEGNTVKIENGYVKEWNNELQLSVGKFGKMKVD